MPASRIEIAIPACFSGLEKERTVFNLDALWWDGLLTSFNYLLSEVRKSVLGKRCSMLSLSLNFPFTVRGDVSGKLDISSGLMWLSYAICSYVSNLASE